MLSSAAYAEQDLTGKVSGGLVGGGVFPADDDIDSTWYVGGNLAYSISNYIAIGGEVGYSSWEDENNGLDYGDVRAIPLLADLYLRHPIDMDGQLFLPYAVVGVGVVFFDYDESSLLESNGIEVDMGTELGVKLGAGFDYFVQEDVALNFEGSYLWSDTDMTVAAFGQQASADIDTDSWMIVGGVKIYFK